MTAAKLPNALPLGRPVEYRDTYTPSLLASIDRSDSREAMAVPEPLPFKGEDVWNAYELTWLDDAGKPEVAAVRINVPCNSPSMVESKSLKLYLNSFAQTGFGSRSEVLGTLNSDLGVAFRAPVMIELLDVGRLPPTASHMPGTCIDTLDVAVSHYDRTPHLLQLEDGQERMVKETLYTHLFRSLCPVTGQPDFATVSVRYLGRPIRRSALLRYLISYRCHQAFHEATVEQIYLDIAAYCRPEQLSVSGHFLRRGGIDINPFRSNVEDRGPGLRLGRQ
ncbi:MAG: NADPH-dependent 7-cyano-7-deazaguanine reductase QueF [Pseudomonadales bacterium]|nr:NADPH-dependent 7-cyano-7-deazaguanine reductase QueF [Pseudomonadales bacterium]